MKDYELHGAGLLGGQGRTARDIYSDSRSVLGFLLVLVLFSVVMLSACAPEPNWDGLRDYFRRGGRIITPGNGDIIFVDPNGNVHSLLGSHRH